MQELKNKKHLTKLLNNLAFLYGECFRSRCNGYVYYKYNYKKTIFGVENIIINLDTYFEVPNILYNQLCAIYSTMCTLLYNNYTK